MLVAFVSSYTMTTEGYVRLGYGLIAVVVLAVVVGAVRVGYYFGKKFSESVGKKERTTISQEEDK